MEIFATEILQELDLATFERLLAKLASAKQKTIRAVADPLTSKQLLTADLFVRNIIQSKLGVKNNQITFTVNAWGKPSLADFPNFHFNLSHCGKWIVCAVDSYPIGIDIEKITYDICKFPLDILAPEEKSQYKHLNQTQKPNFFFYIWTRKESYLKAIGTGIDKFLPSLNVLAKQPLKNYIAQSFFFKQYTLNDYTVAVCAAHQNFSPNISLIENQTLLS